PAAAALPTTDRGSNRPADGALRDGVPGRPVPLPRDARPRGLIALTGVRIRVVPDADQLTRTGADLVAGVIAATPTASVGAATGRSPMGLYAELAARRRSGLVDTAGITAFLLDEYLGLQDNDPRSLLGWL